MTPASKTKLLFVTTDYPPQIGGLQTYSLRIANSLPIQILRHVLIGRDVSSSEIPLPQSGASISSHRGRTRLRAFAWSLWYIPETLIRYRLNFILHMQWSTAIPSLLLKKMGFNIHYVVLIHGAELLDPKRLWLHFIKSMVLENADAVVAGSNHTSEILSHQKINCKRLEVVHYGNPLEVAALNNVSPKGNRDVTETPRLLTLHRLVRRKGTHLLLEALALLTDYNWTLEIVGEGEEEENLRKQVGALNLQKRIQFHAPVSEAVKVQKLQSASLLILPSLPPLKNNHFEGLGLTLLEAQSMGCPVLAARTGGIPEAIQEGITGILFRAGDLADLRSKLVSLLRSQNKREMLGQAGPEWVKNHFNWSKSLNRLTEIIEESVSKK